MTTPVPAEITDALGSTETQQPRSSAVKAITRYDNGRKTHRKRLVPSTPQA